MKAAPPQRRPRGIPPQAGVSTCLLRGGTHMEIRPIRPSDENLLARFHQTLSADSVYYRYFSVFTLAQRVEHGRLARICASQPEHDLVLIAEPVATPGQPREIAAVARLSRLESRHAGEFAVVVSDRWQGQGLGTRLLDLLVEMGRAQGLDAITAEVLPENHGMQHLFRKAGFTLQHELGDPDIVAELILQPSASVGSAPADAPIP